MCDREPSSGCFFTSRKGRESTPDLATSPRRQLNPQQQASNTNNNLRLGQPPPMVIQDDFRKVSGISNEIFRQIETVERDHDANTAAELEEVERTGGEMIVRTLNPRHLSKQALDHAKRFFSLQDARHIVKLVEIVKRPAQTLGLYIREGNGQDRSDGVFISRIASESSVSTSGCLQVNDEILAVNMVDVTRMSIDDVVIIMSIPRRLVLVIRQSKYPSQSTSFQQSSSQYRTLEHKAPVVVIKKDLSRDEDLGDEMDDDDRHSSGGPHGRYHPPMYSNMSMERNREQEAERERERHHRDLSAGRHGSDRDRNMPVSRSHLALGIMDSNGDLNGGVDLYYNSRPNQSATLDRDLRSGRNRDRRDQNNSWLYQPPPPPVITEQPKSSHQHYQNSYEKTYPKTLESLAEKVHPFNPGGSSYSTTPRRMSATTSSSRISSLYGSRTGTGKGLIPRSGSDQHLPRVEYDFGPPRQQTQTLLRSSMKSGAPASTGLSGYSRPYGVASSTGYAGSTAALATLSRTRQRPIDYASDTEATCSSSPRSSYYYYNRQTPASSAGLSSTLSRFSSGTAGSGLTSTTGRGLRSNSLPRDVRGTTSRPLQPMSTLPSSASSRVRFERDKRNLLDQHSYDSDGALSAPEIPLNKRKDRGRLTSSPSVFTADEYRAWMSRTPSSSAIFDRIRGSTSTSAASSIIRQKGQRFTFSAENIPERTRQSELLYNYRPGHLSAIATLDRHADRSTSLKRIKHLLELEQKHLANATREKEMLQDRARVLEINPAEFLKYKVESAKPGTDEAPPVSGLLWVHLLAGRGLRAHSGNTNGSTTAPSAPELGATRDLYCVLECDRIHKARTVVRTGDLVFDWDETFELDLVGNKELDFLIYSWDPQYRHKLCYKGSVHMATLLKESPIHQLALKIEPRGTLYLRLRHTDPYHTYLRRSKPLILPTRTKSLSGGLFGGELEAVVMRENITGGVPGGIATSMAVQSNVPIIVRRCVEEVERRGLDIIGLYRLCGSATKKRILREAFERNARTADLSPDAVPDINVITGVLRDYLRELPEPLFTKCLYQMMVDALTVCLQDDPEGNAKLMFSILDCLPKINRATLIYLMDHLALVVSQAARNKMTPQNLAVCFGPILMLHSESRDKELDFQEPINVLRYLLEIWPSKSVRELLMSPNTVQPIPPMRPPKGSPLPQPPPLPMKPASFSHSTGLVPTVSKGIRKPPPALPARCTPVVVASPTSENSSSEDEVQAMKPLTNRDSPRHVISSARNVNGSNITRNEEKWSSGPPRHPPPQLPARIRPGPPNFMPSRMQEANNSQSNGATQQLKVITSGGDGPSPQSSHSSMSSSSPRSLPRSPNERLESASHSTIPLEPMNKTSENEDPMVETPSSSTGTEEDSRRELGERDDADEESSEDDLK
uniref:Rho GTPase-activating protein 100F n=1 Tax=Cacopsylla melanoneura TaxID=428564 RepID=A0A8D9BH80_9HEMI